MRSATTPPWGKAILWRGEKRSGNIDRLQLKFKGREKEERRNMKARAKGELFWLVKVKKINPLAGF